MELASLTPRSQVETPAGAAGGELAGEYPAVTWRSMPRRAALVSSRPRCRDDARHGILVRVANAVDVPSPALLVYPDRIEENLRRMSAAAGGAGRLRPHVKTHKMPEVIRLCLSHGIGKFKTETIAEAERTAAAGADDVLLAYPVVGPAARRIASSPALAFGGLHAYDGHLTDADHDRLVEKVEAAFAPVWRLRDDLEAGGLPVSLVVVAGTPTTPILAARGDVEVSAGTTVLWDCGQPTISPDLDFLNAAVLLARMVSHPSPGRFCLDIGHKAVASEMPHPRVKIFGLEDAAFPIHSEEQLVVETPRAADFPVGTVVYALPRHVCPTVALHEEAVVVRDGRAVDRWHVAARTRRISV
jgi:D-serine deaminase-like pyridoxal phosphate-dependent protein